MVDQFADSRLLGTVAQRIRQVRDQLAPAQLAVANTFFEKYPMAGLEPLAKVAENSGTSAPTVLRLVRKIGFGGYTEFQDALRQEAQDRIFSPIVSHAENRSGASPSKLISDASIIYSDNIRDTFLKIDEKELDLVVREIANLNRRIMVIGGRFSEVLARQLVYYLTILRPNVQLVTADIHSLVDVSDKVTAVVFDFRRYQASTIEWGSEAVKKGAKILLVSDQYLSPLASKSTALLTVSSKGLAPFDSMTGAFAVTELIISEVARALGSKAGDRLAEFVQRQDEQDRIAARSAQV